MLNKPGKTMHFVDEFLERLRVAPTTELSGLRADYERYLATLNAANRVEVIRQVEPVLNELVSRSLDRLEAAAATYLAHNERHLVP